MRRSDGWVLVAIVMMGFLIVRHVGALTGRRAPAPPAASGALEASPEPEAPAEAPPPAVCDRTGFEPNAVAVAVVEPGAPLDEESVPETGADVRWLD